MKTIIKATDTFKEIIGIYLGVVIICAIGYSFAEGKTFLDSLWWAFVTAMTVGYGDMYPITWAGRGIAIILMHLAPLFVIPLIINQVFNKAVENKDKFSDAEQEEMKQRIKNIESLLITNKNNG